MFAAIGRAATRRPWLVIVAWVALGIAIIVAAPSISQVTNPDQSAFLPSSAESAKAADLAQREFPESVGSTAVIVVRRGDGAALADPDLATTGALVQALNAGRPDAVRGVLFDPRRYVAANRSVAMVPVRFAGTAQDPGVQAAVKQVRERAADALTGSGLTAGMTGEAAVAVDNQDAFRHGEKLVTAATLTLILVLLILIFRSPVAALLPLLSVGLVYGISSSLIAVLAKAMDVQLGEEVPTMLTVVLFGIGTDYILFLLFRYRERRRAGDPPATAIVSAVTRVGEAIFSAGLAVIAAFGALVLAALGFFTTLGPALAIGVAVMLLAALTLVPAVVVVLHRWLFWPARERVLATPRLSAASGPPRRSVFALLGRLVARRPAIVAVASVALLGGLAAGALRFAPDYDPIGQLPAKTESTRAYADLKQGFPAGAMNPTTVYLRSDAPLDPARVGTFVRALAAVPGVATPMQPVVAADGLAVAVPLVLAAEPYGSAALDLVSGPLRSTARAAAPAGTEVLVGGQTMAFADVRATTNRDLNVIFPVAGLLFVLILAGLLRALAAPVYLVVLVVLGFVATLGATTTVFQGLLGWKGLAFSIPIILYLFVTAIGTDYNILMTARLREEIREGLSPREAAARAVEHAGPSIAAAAVILAGTFASLLIAGLPFFAQIGFAVTLGIALVAFVVSIMLVPSVTALLGGAAWWPGGRGRGGRRGHRAGRDGRSGVHRARDSREVAEAGARR
jgi:RND superfamily putative drug exporter